MIGQVQHTGQAIGNWVNRSVVDNSRQPILEYLIQGLSSSTFYQVEVLANNEMGKSQPAAGKPFIFLTAEGTVCKMLIVNHSVKWLI